MPTLTLQHTTGSEWHCCLIVSFWKFEELSDTSHLLLDMGLDIVQWSSELSVWSPPHLSDIGILGELSETDNATIMPTLRSDRPGPWRFFMQIRLRGLSKCALLSPFVLFITSYPSLWRRLLPRLQVYQFEHLSLQMGSSSTSYKCVSITLCPLEKLDDPTNTFKAYWVLEIMILLVWRLLRPQSCF